MRFRAASFIVLAVLILTGLRVFLVRADCTSGGSDPGLIVVVGETPIALRFSLASGIPYKLNYPANLALWTSPLRTTSVPSGSVFTSGSEPVFGNANGDGQVRLDDLIFIRNRLGTNNLASDLNANGIVDENDVVLCRNALGSGAGQLTVYVEGVSASSAICDSAIQLLTDPDHDTVFTAAETKGATVAAVSISPTTGGLGTLIAIGIQPAIPPLAFDVNTGATWRGIYQPPAGQATGGFLIAYTASQFKESSASSASIVLGDGQVSGIPSFASVAGGGTLTGTLTLNLSAASLQKTFSFTPITGAGKWESITYQDTSLATGPAVLNAEPSILPVFFASSDPNPVPSEDVLLHSYTVQLASVIRIAKNASTLASAPDYLTVDLVTFNSAGVELDRRSGVRLSRVPGDAGDSTHLVYSSHLLKPIVLVDVVLNQSNYPNVTVLRASAGGSAVIVPAQP